MTRVLLLLDQKENQQLLAEELAGRHEVLIGATDDALNERFDLCVADGRSLDRLWEQVHQRKEREQPLFLPVLLVTSRPDVKMIHAPGLAQRGRAAHYPHREARAAGAHGDPPARTLPFPGAPAAR
jgi:hypothetical protein